jgi:hypothetical protein
MFDVILLPIQLPLFSCFCRRKCHSSIWFGTRSNADMALLARLQALEPNETWPGLEMAARERYWDGVDLATSPASRRTAAIYLLGYVAEMLLKVAFYRVSGVPPGQHVVPAMIKNHSAWKGKKNRHDLENLVDLLSAERASKGLHLDPGFAAQLNDCIQTLAGHWRETLRYRHTPATQTELVEVYQNVDWLFANATLLWS